MRHFVFTAFLLLTIATPLFAVDVSSPDGNYKVVISVTGEGIGSALTYAIWYKGSVIVLPSTASLNIKRPLDMFENLTILRIDSSSHQSQWIPQYGERNAIPDNFNEIVLTIANALDTLRRFQFVWRAYNEGVAFRFNFPEMKGTQIIDIIDEEVDFSMPGGTYAFFSPRTQASYSLRPLKGSWSATAEKPLTMLLPDSVWVSILEADMKDYSAMKLALNRSGKSSLTTTLFGPVTGTSPFATPWRVVMAASEPGDLLENNYLILNLNPHADGNWSWVKPGKVIRSMDLTARGAKECIDFAVDRGLQYILLDAGWYGDEYLSSSKVVKRAKKNTFTNPDLPVIIKYAKKNRIGVWLYVNHRQLEVDMDAIFKLFEDYGVAGVKFGFVHTGSHRWTTWLVEAVQKAAKHKLMVNIHDDYRPSGLSRTFPNLLTQEGILGNEAMPDATHNTVLPFTRMLAGAADYTFSYYMREGFLRANKYIQPTPAHQLALPVIYFSPLQFLFWYDRPSDYKGEQELEFWKQLPVTWDETRVVSGAPGSSAVVARKHKTDWFVGAITNTDSTALSIPLDFLAAEKKYEAVIYFDDPANTTSRTKVSRKILAVEHTTVLQEELPPSGGVAIHIRQTN